MVVFFLQIALEGLRVSIPPGLSPHIAKLIRICMNEDPGKRPTFDMISPILGWNLRLFSRHFFSS